MHETKNGRFIGFDRLKQSISMPQVLARYGLLETLRRSGDSLSGVCPLHHGHNPTQFRISLSKNCWICFGDCHAGGSIVDFVSRKEGVSVRDAGLLLQDWFQVRPDGNGQIGRNGRKPMRPVPAAAPEPPSENRPLRFPLHNLDPTHLYLVARGLSQETIQTFGIGYCPNGLLAGRIAIPIHNEQGELVAYAGRWPGPPPADTPKYKLPRGFRKSLELFNLHRAREARSNEPLVIVEGYFGCMLIWQAGHHRVVSLMGSMLSERQQELIIAHAGPLKRVILLFDEDEAGRRGRAEARARLSKHLEVQVIQFALPGMQPDQLPADRLLELLRWPKEGT